MESAQSHNAFALSGSAPFGRIEGVVSANSESGSPAKGVQPEVIVVGKDLIPGLLLEAGALSALISGTLNLLLIIS